MLHQRKAKQWKCVHFVHSSSQQVADVLSKGLLRQNFDFFVSKLGLIDVYVPT